MLVLSRGCNDKVVFPTLGISVEIVRIVGSRVRIGIDAPRDIPILRDEILGQEQLRSPERKQLSASLNHAVRNRLQNATLGLRLVQKMLELDKADDIESTIFKIFNDLKSLEEELAGPEIPPVAKAQPAKQSKSCRALIVEDDVNETPCEGAGDLHCAGECWILPWPEPHFRRSRPGR